MFVVLIRKFDQSQTLNPDWSELGLIRAELGRSERNVVLKSRK